MHHLPMVDGVQGERTEVHGPRTTLVGAAGYLQSIAEVPLSKVPSPHVPPHSAGIHSSTPQILMDHMWDQPDVPRRGQPCVEP